MTWHFKQSWLFRYNYLFILIISLIIIGLLIFFLYNNFYQTIAQTQTIVVLQNEVGLENIDINLFEQIQQINKDKKAGFPNLLTPPQTKWLNLKNPFIPY